ncbi:MAG: hypothetical protein R3A13_00800 [Bdellovibrionota bacterium]
MYLAKGQTGIMVVRDFDKLNAVKLADLADNEGKIISQSVNLESDLYKIASKYMFK